MHLDVRDRRAMAFEIRTGGDDAWSDQCAGCDLAPPPANRREVAAHIAHTGDAICDIKTEQLPTRRNDGVYVHVPETRDQILAAGIDDACRARRWRARGGTDRRDARTVDENGEIWSRRSSLDVDCRHVRDGNELEEGGKRGGHAENMSSGG